MVASYTNQKEVLDQAGFWTSALALSSRCSFLGSRMWNLISKPKFLVSGSGLDVQGIPQMSFPTYLPLAI